MEAPTYTQPSPTRTSYSMTMIPIEILAEILVRLPAKTILRSKVVCKSWFSLMASRYFINLHLSQSLKFPMRSVFILNKNMLGPFYSLHLNEPGSVPAKIALPPSPKDWHRIVGTCNGLVCFEELSGDYLILYNPTTRRKRTVPRPPKLMENKHHYRTIIGFGYEPVADDYKILTSIDEIFSLRNYRWKNMQEKLPNTWYGISQGKFLNGCLNWLISPCNDFKGERRSSLLVLDLHDETYSYMDLPHDTSQVIGPYLSLSEFRSDLCLIASYLPYIYVENELRKFHPPGERFDVWVMKDYGLKESWTKLLSVPFLSIDRTLAYTVSGCKVLVRKLYSTTPVWYDLNTGKEEMINNDILSCGCDVEQVCVESLVTLDAY